MTKSGPVRQSQLTENCSLKAFSSEGMIHSLVNSFSFISQMPIFGITACFAD